MRKLSLSYALAIVAGVALAGVLSWLAVRERDRSVAAARKTVRESSRAITGALRGSIQSEIYGTKLLQERLQSVLDGVVSTTDVDSILLKQGDQKLAAAGDINPLVDLSTGGEKLNGNTFFYWETIHLQAVDGPRHGVGMGKGSGKGRGKGHGRWRRETAELEPEGVELDLGTTPQVLAIGLSASHYWTAAESANRRMWLTIAVSAGAAVALALAWMLTARGQSLRGKLQAAQNRAEQLDEFELAAFGLAHETKHPLGIIRGLAQQVADNTDEGSQQQEKAMAIMQEADIAVDRLGDFMLYAKTRTPEKKPVELHTVLNRVADLLRPEFEAERIELVVDAATVIAQADEDMLSRVLINILKNANQACTEGNTVKVSTSVADQQFSICVHDDGSGIDADLLPNVFKPYVTGRKDGHGIGLAIVKRIVEEHGWDVTVTSGGEGTAFTITGPAV